MVINNQVISFLVTIVFLVILTSCRQDTPKPKAFAESAELKESMARANIMLSNLESEKINAFVKRYNWKMDQSGTGLRYYIYTKTKGLTVDKGDSVILNYTVSLLNGELLYSSTTDGSLIFETGKGKTINGLEEGVFLMRMGERAKLIVPSHLAFGLLGDQKKIPQRATLVYDVELRTVKKRQ